MKADQLVLQSFLIAMSELCNFRREVIFCNWAKMLLLIEGLDVTLMQSLK
jgi:hypothetical protein